MGYSICGVSLWTITSISVYRFMTLHYRMKYTILMTESRVIYTVVIIWLVNFLSSGFYFCNTRTYFFILSLITVICIIISSLSYIMIYRIARQHQSRIHVQQQAVQSCNGTHSRPQSPRSFWSAPRNLRIQGNTGEYRGIQGNTGEYRGIQGNTEEYK